MRPAPDRRPRMPLLGRGSWGEVSRIGDVLRTETVGGALLLAAAVVALLWANSPWRGAYHALGAVRVGPHALHLDLSLAEWAADGLLAVLIGELAFGVGTRRDADAKIGILLGSLIAATLAAVVLRIRNVHYSRLRRIEELDRGADGIPDVYQQEDLAI